MGPLSDSQLTISPVFYVTLVDLWGPVKCFAPDQHRELRTAHSKHYDGYFMVLACASNGTVNIQFLEVNLRQVVFRVSINFLVRL